MAKEKALRAGKVLSNAELSAFCAQMAMILRSGISAEEGISILLEDSKDAQTRAILNTLHGEVERGESLYSALKTAGQFPRYLLDMVHIGERSGKLDEVMDALCSYYEREESISKSVRNAVMYPLIMIVMMVVVISVLVVKVLPIFDQVFRQLGSEMTGLPKGIMNTGTLIGNIAMVLVGIIAILAVIYFILRSTKGGRNLLTRFQSKFFITRNLSAKIASGRFASGMSLMLASGLDTDESLKMVADLVDNVVLREKIEKCQQSIQDGVNFSEALVKAEIFSGIYARMVTVGFKTGAADTVMQKLADRYEEETDAQISHIISILEPTLVAVLSIIVGMILLSVMLPLMGIMSAIG